MTNSLVPANTPLFTFDQVEIGIQDLVRTGFQEKYNVLASAVISDITYRFDDAGTTGSTQILEFHTNDGVIEIPVAGGGFIGDICAIDVCYEDAQNRFDNVQDALDYLLNPYQPPTGNTTGAPGIKEVGDSSFYPVIVTTAGTRTVKDLEYVKLIDFASNTYTSIPNPAPPGVSNISVSHPFDLVSSPALDPSSPIKYTWTGKVKDVENLETNAGSDSLQYVYPYYKFNAPYLNYNVNDPDYDPGQPTLKENLESLINTGIIPSILNSSIAGPSQIQLDAAGTSLFMHILVPAAYDNVSEIIDANLGLGSAPGWDTFDSQDPATEFRRADVVLTKTGSANAPQWNSIQYRIYYSKIEKSNISLIFKL